MKSNLTITPIGHITSDFPSKFGIPRQSGLTPGLKSYIILEKEFRNPDIIRGLRDFSHIWLIWGFSENSRDSWSATVRPPRLGGNKRVGVFATRSPFRPNPLGLSSVKVESIDTDSNAGPIICVSGADLMDGTPIYDIKPYIGTDCHVDAVCGFADEVKDYSLEVNLPDELSEKLTSEQKSGLICALSQDPRPSYQNDPDRVYGFPFAGFEVKFYVKNQVLTVTELTP